MAESPDTFAAPQSRETRARLASGRLKMPPFIVTLGTFGMTFGAADLLTGGTNLSSVPTRFQDTFGNGSIAGIYVPVLVAGAIVIVAYVVLRMTRFGAYTRAIGSNE